MTMSWDFKQAFNALTGHDPFPWQCRLFEKFAAGHLPKMIDIPTGLGKTATMALWLLARASKAPLPRRLVYVVDRRAVVDQATDFADTLGDNLANPNHKCLEEVRQGLGLNDRRLAISTLRGRRVDNREWLEDPTAPAIIVGTVDMIGSRLLFDGYGVSRWMRPYMAGLLGSDTLILLDEAHLARPFECLLRTIENEQKIVPSPTDEGKTSRGSFAGISEDATLVPRLSVLPLSATLIDGLEAQAFRLDPDEDRQNKILKKRLEAKKLLKIFDLEHVPLEDALADEAWGLFLRNSKVACSIRILVYCDSRKVAEKVAKRIQKKARSETSNQPKVILFVGGRRVHEREDAAEEMKDVGLIPGNNAIRNIPVFLVATSAGEVGVDMDADHMVSDLVPWERMVQRLGRVNRRGERQANVSVIDQGTDGDDASSSIQQFVRVLLEKLPRHGTEGYWAGPAMLAKLAADPDLNQLVSAASTVTPLYPKLTRPLIDAWAMTSLTSHTGRPEIAPWLRGWVDSEPETVMAWRFHFPLRLGGMDGGMEVNGHDVESFFDAAPLQASELLEVETWKVVDWLRKRAKLLMRAQERTVDQGDQVSRAEKNDDAETVSEIDSLSLHPSDVIALLLSTSGSLKKLFRLEEIDRYPPQKLQQELAGGRLVVQASFGGIKEGLLDVNYGETATTIEDNWGCPEAWADAVHNENGAESLPAIRIRKLNKDGSIQNWNQRPDKDSLWQGIFELPIEVSIEGEPLSKLIVEKWHGKEISEDGRAIASNSRYQSLAEHQEWTAHKAEQIAIILNFPDECRTMLRESARRHDEGKKADRWQRAFNAPHDGRPYGKTRGPFNRHVLSGYRHEFQSMLDTEKECINGMDGSSAWFDLALHLIAAHHGRARPTINIEGCDSLPPSRAARHAHDIALRFARLQKQWGPWGLAWWESLLRSADWQASRQFAESNSDAGEAG